MKAGGDSIGDTLRLVAARLRGRHTTHSYADDEPPLRAELFGADQMEQHGRPWRARTD